MERFEGGSNEARRDSYVAYSIVPRAEKEKLLVCSTLALIESGGKAAQEVEHVHCLLIPNAGPVHLVPVAALMQLALTTAALVSLRAEST